MHRFNGHLFLFFYVKSHATAPAEHDRKLARVPPTMPNEREKKLQRNKEYKRRPIRDRFQCQIQNSM